MEGERILIVEDEKELAQVLGDYLEAEGFKAEICFDGKQGLDSFHSFNPQLALIDIMLPEIDGIELCKRIRAVSTIPIIMVTAKNGDMDKVISLGVGADDYITKPFSPLELMARVKAHLRRYVSYIPKAPEKPENNNSLVFGKLTLNKDAYAGFVEDKELSLTTKEFEILYFMCSNSNQVFSKEQLYNTIWGFNEYGDINSVAVYVKRLREKLGSYGLDYIKTVWGVGYKVSK